MAKPRFTAPPPPKCTLTIWPTWEGTFNGQLAGGEASTSALRND